MGLKSLQSELSVAAQDGRKLVRPVVTERGQPGAQALALRPIERPELSHRLAQGSDDGSRLEPPVLNPAGGPVRYPGPPQNFPALAQASRF